MAKLSTKCSIEHIDVHKLYYLADMYNFLQI